MAGRHVKGTNDADGNGKKGGSLPKLDPKKEAEAARKHSEGV